jgi:integrase
MLDEGSKLRDYLSKEGRRHSHAPARGTRRSVLVQAQTNARRPPERIGRRLYEYVQGDGQKSYYADVKIDGRQTRVKLVASSKGEARKAQADLVSKDNRNELVAPAKKTVRQVGDEWLRTLNVKPRSREAYEYHLRLNIYPQFGDRRVQDIRPQDVADLVVWLRDVRKVGGQTATGALGTLSGLLTHAVWNKDIPSNPLTALPKGRRPKRKSPKRQQKEHRYLTAEERDRLLKALTPTYRPVVFVALWTGLRENELLGLTWGDIDLKDKKIHVRKQLSRPTNDRPAVRVSLKTEEARDVDILNPDLVLFLREHKLASQFSQETDYLFCTSSGRPIHYRTLGKAFSGAADKAKLNPDGRRKLRFHDLRRTYASVLLPCGEFAWVAEQLGHTVAVLLDTYSGVIEANDGAEKGAAAIQAARGQS